MLQIIADANVLISAAISPHGASAQIVQLAQQGVITLVVCETLIDEVAEVLARDRLRRRITPEEATAYVDAITLLAHWTDNRPDSELPLVCPDPDDNYLIALYQDAEAHMLVSGDKGVQGVQYPNVYIYSPADALETIKSQHGQGDQFLPGDFEQWKRSAEGEGSIALMKVYAVFLSIVVELAPNVIEQLQSVMVPSAIPRYVPVLAQLRAILASRGVISKPLFASPEVAYLQLPPSPDSDIRATSDFRLPPDTVFATLLRCPDLIDPPNLSFDHWRVLAIGAAVSPQDIPHRG